MRRKKEDLILCNTAVDKCHGPSIKLIYSIERSWLSHVCNGRTTEDLVVVNRADMKMDRYLGRSGEIYAQIDHNEKGG